MQSPATIIPARGTFLELTRSVSLAHIASPSHAPLLHPAAHVPAVDAVTRNARIATTTHDMASCAVSNPFP
jgi:hypothetical protein